MPLIKCPHCKKEISDLATTCPYCGFEIKRKSEKETRSFDKPREKACIEQHIKKSKKEINKIPLYKKSWFIFIMCFIFAPIGIVLLWTQNKPKNKTVRIVITVLLCAWFLSVAFGNITNRPPNNESTQNENINNTSQEKDTSVRKDLEENEQTESKVQNEPVNDDQSEMSSDEKLIYDLKNVLSEDIANKAYDILKNQIGFSEIEFYDRLSEGNDTYELFADDFDIYLTASDDVYRIFNQSYVFYENGEVQNTVESVNQKRITSSDATSYYVIAKEIIESYLKSPGSANFPWQDEITFQKNGNIVGVQGYVDALNSFGVETRSQWLVEFEVVDLSSFSYNIIYVRIDEETSGEFIDLD